MATSVRGTVRTPPTPPLFVQETAKARRLPWGQAEELEAGEVAGRLRGGRPAVEVGVRHPHLGGQRVGVEPELQVQDRPGIEEEPALDEAAREADVHDRDLAGHP